MAKIVIDARDFRGTGIGRYVERLLHYLQEIDTTNKYQVLLKPKDMEAWQPTNRHFTKVACHYKEFTFGEQLGLLKQLRSLKPDLVHFPMVQQPVLYRGKIITTMLDLTTVRFRNPSKNWLVFTFKRWVYKWVNKIVARKSAAIIAISEFVKDDLAKFARINSRKITVTYLAADTISDEAEPIEELIDTKFIMYVGRPLPHKNLDRLIKAFELLKQTHPELKLVLAGKTDLLYRRTKWTVRRSGISDVVFTGFVSEGQLKWLYQNTAAYVFPSLSEGFGLPGLEAMLHGAPVAASNATCLPEIYGEAAVYFDPLSVEEMASTIGDLIDNPKKGDNLRELGKARAATYSWKRTALQTLDLYKEVLNS